MIPDTYRNQGNIPVRGGSRRARPIIRVAGDCLRSSRTGVVGPGLAHRVRRVGLRAKPGQGAASRLREVRRASRRPGEGSGAFGKDGKPSLYVNGPCDDTYRIMAKLRQAIGDARLSWQFSSRMPATTRMGGSCGLRDRFTQLSTP